MPAQSKSPIPKPWESVELVPLPDEESRLLAEIFEYAEQLADADSRADSTSMDKAAKLEALYASTAWSDEWDAAKPAKPRDAIGRPVDPRSRNRFNEWLQERARKEHRQALKRTQIYRLLTAQDVASYIPHGTKLFTETSLRPWSWMLSRGYAEHLPDVVRNALDYADGGPITEKIARKALAEWKADFLGPRETRKANLAHTARSRRRVVETDFKDLLMYDADEAREFLMWARDQLRLRAVPSKSEESA